MRHQFSVYLSSTNIFITTCNNEWDILCVTLKTYYELYCLISIGWSVLWWKGIEHQLIQQICNYFADILMKWNIEIDKPQQIVVIFKSDRNAVTYSIDPRKKIF